MTGSRACETHVYKYASFPLALLGPMTIIWQPLSSEANSSRTQEPPVQPGKGKGKGKGKNKEKQTEDNPPPESSNGLRVIWIRCHPAIFEEVFETLQTSASHVLEQSKKKDPQLHAEIQIADLRGCINAFEIMGPKSSQVIKGALSPVGNDDRKDVKQVREFYLIVLTCLTSTEPQFWDSLTDLQTSGSIARGMVIGLKVLDPRLKYSPRSISCSMLKSDWPFAGSLRGMQNPITPMLRNLLASNPHPSSSQLLLRRRARFGMKRSGDFSRSRGLKRRTLTRGVRRLARLQLLRCMYTLPIYRTSSQVLRSILSVRTIESPSFLSSILSNSPLQLPRPLGRSLTHRVSTDGRCCSLQVGLWLFFLLFFIRELDLLANANARNSSSRLASVGSRTTTLASPRTVS